MKKIMINIANRLFAIVLMITMLSSCTKFGEDVTTPFVKVTVSPANPKVGDEVTITVTTDGQYVSLYTGDAGHQFDRSRVKALMEQDWDSFYDTCYRVSFAKNGEKQTWNRYVKDYNSLEDLRKDFEFFGAVDNVQLVKYNRGDFPEALLEMSYPGTNQLKLTLKDRRIPSGIRFKPNIHLMGGLANRPGLGFIESRFVACDADRALRKISGDNWANAYFRVYTEQLAEHEGYPAGYQYSTLRHPVDGRFGVFQTNDPLSRRPTEGYYQMDTYYSSDPYLSKFLDYGEKLVQRQVDIHLTGRLTTEGAADSPYQYDFDGDGVLESYICELDPATGLPARPNDYGYYKGFQGDVYLSFIEWGTNEYEPWHTGVSLGSVYVTGGIKDTYTYKYTTPGEFTITVVASNISDKNYENVDYSKQRKNSYDDYNHLRALSEVKISVQP